MSASATISSGGNEGIGTGGTGGTTDAGTTTTSDDGPKLDVLDAGDETDGSDGGGCTIPEHTPCDEPSTATPGESMGLGCPGELPLTLIFSGSPDAVGVRSGFGPTTAFDPREGESFVVLSTGPVSELDTPNMGPTPVLCSGNLGAAPDDGNLPPPLVPMNVGVQDCAEAPALVGTGDCSNTIQGQYEEGGALGDYSELRLEQIQVPDGVTSFSYDFAFFSTEYPEFFQSPYNDMYVGWLESMQWTGNISFDEEGNPISLNAGFLDYKNGAVELNNTCVNFNAGTKWLTSTAAVTPGEVITLVFAIFDLNDSKLDSFVFLDAFRWGCEGGAPSTMPVG